MGISILNLFLTVFILTCPAFAEHGAKGLNVKFWDPLKFKQWVDAEPITSQPSGSSEQNNVVSLRKNKGKHFNTLDNKRSEGEVKKQEPSASIDFDDSRKATETVPVALRVEDGDALVTTQVDKNSIVTEWQGGPQVGEGKMTPNPTVLEDDGSTHPMTKKDLEDARFGKKTFRIVQTGERIGEPRPVEQGGCADAGG